MTVYAGSGRRGEPKMTWAQLLGGVGLLVGLVRRRPFVAILGTLLLLEDDIEDDKDDRGHRG